MKWVGKTQENSFKISSLEHKYAFTCTHTEKVCLQSTPLLLLECWIQRVCCYKMMCEEKYRMRKWIRKHSRHSSPGDKACQAAVWFERYLESSAEEARAGLIKKEGEIERDKFSFLCVLVIKHHPSTDEAILALAVRVPGRWEAMASQELMCGGLESMALGGLANGLCMWLCSCCMDMSVGQVEKNQSSLSALQLLHALWHGPEAPLLKEHRCHRGFQGKVFRKSCYLK